MCRELLCKSNIELKHEMALFRFQTYKQEIGETKEVGVINVRLTAIVISILLAFNKSDGFLLKSFRLIRMVLRSK